MNCTRPEEILREKGFTYVIPRVNDYTRMFSVPARRSAPAHPETPRTDKKARASLASPASPASPTSPTSPLSPIPSDVQLRKRPAAPSAPEDRLSASDFYTVSEDVTPQPFKGILNC